jgi:glyoxylate reductase
MTRLKRKGCLRFLVLKPSVYLTRNIPRAIEILKKSCDVTVHKAKTTPSKKEIIRNVEDKEGLLCSLYESIDREIISAASNLKVISSYSVGYDHIDVQAATERGICVTYTPDVLTETTADLAFGLMLSTARRIAEGDSLVRRGKWSKNWQYDFMLGGDVHGKTLGIIGMGRIGMAVARRSRCFDMKVLYHNRNRLPAEREVELSAEYRSLDDLLSESDFVSIHLPLTSETRHLIDEKRLKLMKATSYLINTARGPVVDEKALVKALKYKWIAGAGVDVFEKEPVSRGSELLRMRNVILAPHIGSASIETRRKMAEVAALNLLNVLNGKMPLYTVNPQVLG